MRGVRLLEGIASAGLVAASLVLAGPDERTKPFVAAVSQYAPCKIRSHCGSCDKVFCRDNCIVTTSQETNAAPAVAPVSGTTTTNSETLSDQM
jgi:hypothetical protein